MTILKNLTTMIKNYVRVLCSNIFRQEKIYTSSLYSFPIITVSYMVDYLVAAKIYNICFGKLVPSKCSEFINIYYCAMQHELLNSYLICLYSSCSLQTQILFLKEKETVTLNNTKTTEHIQIK